VIRWPHGPRPAGSAAVFIIAWPAAGPPELWRAQSEFVEGLRAALRGGGD